MVRFSKSVQIASFLVPNIETFVQNFIDLSGDMGKKPYKIIHFHISSLLSYENELLQNFSY